MAENLSCNGSLVQILFLSISLNVLLLSGILPCPFCPVSSRQAPVAPPPEPSPASSAMMPLRPEKGQPGARMVAPAATTARSVPPTQPKAPVQPPAPTSDAAECLGDPRTIFVDLGANCGNSYEYFLRDFVHNPTVAYLFEFHPELIGEYLDPLAKRDKRVVLIKAAAYTRDGTVDVYLDSRHEKPGQIPCVAQKKARNPHGVNSLFKGFKRGRASALISAAAVDLVAWMRRHLCAKDKVYMKMDVEGAEYMLIDAMMTAGVQCLVDEYFIEFHKQPTEVTVGGKPMSNVEASMTMRQELAKCGPVKDWF
eukprot:NODE_2148_length_977_cov_11.340517_g1762_i0.p1 GENE.NODE_2148_length_977_cov_11.340517_g1762_i0~~NODE_2148_length_977_cov_11.340517_g1762_i0.p1  ORF type:complete len:320 (-),score=93.03 NODE_2148_length_977_cov_11.340517_g1762_i0:18-947(-)